VLLVGLTGNYGMGKSVVLSIFQKSGAVVMDADEIVGSLLKESEVIEKVKGLLGDKVFLKNGSLDKEKVADIIFHDESLRRSLEDILHPLVFEKINVELAGIRDRDTVALVEIPLLFEREYERRFDKVITVYSEEKIVMDRLKKEGISCEEALLRLKSQMPIEEKMRRSDFTINNNHTIEETASQVEAIYKELLKEAKKDGNNTGSRKPKQELS
jgi:dephospho-CoA kinase